MGFESVGKAGESINIPIGKLLEVKNNMDKHHGGRETSKHRASQT